MKKPGFICVGTQKCATTWLHTCLRAHPDIWLPPIKELHYFSKRGMPDYQSHRIWRVAHRAGRWLETDALALHDLAWTRDYVLGGPPDDDWYLSLFSPVGARLAGEVTPNYCAMSADRFAAMAAMLPDAKIIFLMRSPLARAWAGFLTYCSMSEIAPERALQEKLYIDYLCREDIVLLSDYARSLSLLRRFWPPQQILYAFYSEIDDQPQDFLRRLVAFLGLPYHPNLDRLAPRRMHVSPQVPPPDDLRALLAPQLLPMLDALAPEFPRAAAAWRAEVLA